jgi:ABC-type cobalamin transport system permease subunit
VQLASGSSADRIQTRWHLDLFLVLCTLAHAVIITASLLGMARKEEVFNLRMTVRFLISGVAIFISVAPVDGRSDTDV